MLIFTDGIGWKVKLTIKLSDHVIWMQSIEVNMDEMVDEMNEMDCEWKGNKNETSMRCGLKEMRWNMNNEVDNVTYLTDPAYHQKAIKIT